MAEKTTKMVPVDVYVTMDGMEFRSYEEAEHWDSVLKLTELLKRCAPLSGTPEEIAEWVLSEMDAIADISGEYEYVSRY